MTYRQCPHGFHHPPGPHSCDGCWCEGERDRAMYGWDHDTAPTRDDHQQHPDPVHAVCAAHPNEGDTMTKYTAEDFARAEFARHKNGWIAARMEDDSLPWRSARPRGDAWAWYTDANMAADPGWSIVRHADTLTAREHLDAAREKAHEVGRVPALECPDLEQHDDRYVSPLAVKRVKEVQARAEKAERERDEALAAVRVLARENIECHERAAVSCWHPNHGNQDHDCAPFMPAAESRPLTPDAITNEMVKRGVEKSRSLPTAMSAHARVSIILTAALTDPPARPEGAEEWEDWLIEALPHESMPDEDIALLADRIAAHLTEKNGDPR